MGVFNQLVVHTLPFVPKFIVGAVSRRYIAGETLAEALGIATDLNRRGFMTTLDLLGEDTRNVEQARRTAREYRTVLEALGKAGIEGNISVKPTQFGLKVDPKLCLELFRGLIEEARSLGYFVRVEMEDASSTEPTIELYRALLPNFDNVGIVIQAYLYRSKSDVASLAGLTPNVRIVKGVYVEPESIAHRDADAIRSNFLTLSETLLRAGAYVAFATHDETLIQQSFRLVDALGLDPTAYEFQMLLGVQEKLRQTILDSGHRTRVYIPFGADWYAYSVRRLRENPKIAGYVFKAMLRGE